MALNKALVDECRRVYEVEDDPDPVLGEGGWSETWEEGEPDAQERRGPWIKCRLTINQPTEATRTYRNRVPVLEGDAELLIGTRDREGTSLADRESAEFQAFGPEDRLEVRSKQLGTAVWRVQTGVEPIRKLRRVLGYRVGLARTSEATR